MRHSNAAAVTRSAQFRGVLRGTRLAPAGAHVQPRRACADRRRHTRRCRPVADRSAGRRRRWWLTTNWRGAAPPPCTVASSRSPPRGTAKPTPSTPSSPSTCCRPGACPDRRHAWSLKQLGGVVADTAFVVGGQARFEVGEEVLVFVDVRPRDRTLSVAGLERGKWTLTGSADPATAMAREIRGTDPSVVVARDFRSLVDLQALAALAGTRVSAADAVLVPFVEASAAGPATATIRPRLFAAQSEFAGALASSRHRHAGLRGLADRRPSADRRRRAHAAVARGGVVGRRRGRCRCRAAGRAVRAASRTASHRTAASR